MAGWLDAEWLGGIASHQATLHQATLQQLTELGRLDAGSSAGGPGGGRALPTHDDQRRRCRRPSTTALRRRQQLVAEHLVRVASKLCTCSFMHMCCAQMSMCTMDTGAADSICTVTMHAALLRVAGCLAADSTSLSLCSCLFLRLWTRRARRKQQT